MTTSKRKDISFSMANKVRRISAYGLIIAEESILLSLLNKGPNKGKWHLVGGEIEFGETPEEAFHRELNEEAGIVLNAAPNLLTILSARYKYKNEKHQDEDFQILGIIYSALFDKKTVCKEDSDGESSNGCRWFKIQEVREIQTTSFVTEALKKAGL